MQVDMNNDDCNKQMTNQNEWKQEKLKDNLEAQLTLHHSE